MNSSNHLLEILTWVPPTLQMSEVATLPCVLPFLTKDLALAKFEENFGKGAWHPSLPILDIFEKWHQILPILATGVFALSLKTFFGWAGLQLAAQSLKACQQLTFKRFMAGINYHLKKVPQILD